jgi:hypothetical protein
MAPIQPPSFLHGVGHPASSDRLTIGALLSGGPGGTTTLGGVRPTQGTVANTIVSARTPNDKYVRVRACTTWVPSPTGGGLYSCHNDGDWDIRIPDAHASLARKDLIVARVYDVADLGSAEDTWNLEPVEGTPATSPQDPPTPPGSYALASVRVDSATANPSGALAQTKITPLHSFQSAVGGTRLVPSLAAMNALPAYAGMEVFRTDQGVKWYFTGSVWTPTPGSYIASARGNPGPAGQVVSRLAYRQVVLDLLGTNRPTGAFALVSNAITVPLTGGYVITGQLEYDSPDGTGQRQLALFRDFGLPTQVLFAASDGPAIADVHLNLNVTSRITFLNAGDRISMALWQGSGSNVTVFRNSASPYLNLIHYGP